MSVSVKIDASDISVLVVYFFGILITSFVSMFVAKRGTVSGYFLAGRLMTWLPIGASLFASNIGSEHFIGLAGSGAASGIGVGAFELNASILLQLLGWVFLPVYIASGVCTLPEYMRKRFGGRRIQIYLACLSLLLYVFTKISVNLYSGSLFLREALQWNIWISVLLILGLTSLITVAGGLAAVIYTDTLQFFVMILGALVLAILSFIKVGGFSGVLSYYGQAIAAIDLQSDQGASLLISLANASYDTAVSLADLASVPGIDPGLSCSLPAPKAFKLLREVDDPDMPWLGFLLGQTPASIWYWCADQMMVQRVLAAKSLSHAQGATLMAGVFKQLPLFMMVVPGMISRMLFPDEIACIPGDHCFKVCGQRSGCSNLAYPKLVVGIMPSGLRGLMLAVMLAALISDLTSIFNSASTLFTVDIYKQFRKNAKEKELMVTGRSFVVFLVLVSVGWIPVVQQLQGSQLFIYIQAVSAYLAPPVAAVYLLAVLWPRANEMGAFFALVFGLFLGIARLILSVIYSDPVCGEQDTRPWFVGQLHYMYFGLGSFFATALIVIITSFLGRKPPPEQVNRLTYFTAWDAPEPPQEVLHVSDYNVLEKLHSPGKNKPIQDFPETIGDFCNAQPGKGNSKNSQKLNQAVLSDWNSFVTVRTTSTPDLGNRCDCYSGPGICLLHALRWFCGCEDRPCNPSDEARFLDCICCCRRKSVEATEPNTYEHDLAEQHAVQPQRIFSLHQDPKEKVLLYVGLFIILTLSSFGFIFFSVYFDLVKAGPLFVKPFSNITLSPNVTEALERLLDLGIVSNLTYYPRLYTSHL
ncbi:unnamed protein product [Dicrocoelium dendriticum]|nr:unnamed protein product [Dicrocoelium dendriticum]